MQYFHDALTLTCEAKGMFAAGDLVGFNDQKITSDDAPVKGVAKNPATEIGLHVGVIALGMVRIRASGTITAGMKVMSAAGGGVKNGASATNPCGIALTAAADGEFVDILFR